MKPAADADDEESATKTMSGFSGADSTTQGDDGCRGHAESRKDAMSDHAEVARDRRCLF